MKKLFLILGVVTLCALLFFVYKESKNQLPTSNNLLLYVSNQNIAVWSNPEKTTKQIGNRTITGTEIKGKASGEITEFMGFENKKELENKGFISDTALFADGPGSSVWGYKKNDDDRTQIILFSYSATPTNANLNEPAEFNCPCKIHVTVFVSNPFTKE